MKLGKIDEKQRLTYFFKKEKDNRIQLPSYMDLEENAESDLEK